MAEQGSYVETDAKLGINESMNMHTNKRKRDSADTGSASSRPAPGDSVRTSTNFRRVSPGPTNNTSSGTTNINDPSGASFLVHNTTSSGDDNMHHGSNAMDFNVQLVQHATDPSLHQNGGGNASSASDTAAAALSHHFSMSVPQSTERAFQNQGAAGEGDRSLNTSFNMGDHNVHHSPHGMGEYNLDALKAGTHQAGAAPQESPPATTTPTQKPPVGSEEWHKVRRDNHKEVERRRRETINEGINELAKIVPGCEKNKGSILQRAVQFITQLKENETQNIEKWTLEKLLTDQAISELSQSCDNLKAECRRARAEAEVWKKACEANGIVPEEYQNKGEGGDTNGDS